YHESRTPPARHSPILGWVQDGYPLYGPYGYANLTNPAGGVRRMVSGFAARNGANGTDNLAQTGRHAVPAWTAREFGGSAALRPFEYGPNVSAQYPIGHYLEDYAFLGDVGKTQGRDFDLDECNGRWCVTPEFPQGTYAYFTTIDADGKPVYPYNMGRRYHGQPTGRLLRAIAEPVTTNFTVHASSSGATASAAASKTVALTWTANGGGTYQAGAK